MTRLLLDIGNTNLRWTLQGEGASPEIRLLRHGGGVPLDLLADWEALGAPDQVVVSNVGGEAVAEALTRVTVAYWGRRPHFVAVRESYGAVRIAYQDPSRFGVDRWLALIASHALDAGAAVILDAGTAATFDLLLADGRHLGGSILPGIEMMRASLLVGTRIPRVGHEPTGEPWATDTGPAIAAGSLHSIAALAARLYDRLAEETGATPSLLLTGGDAERVGAVLDRPYREIPDLVLRGLAILADEIG